MTEINREFLAERDLTIFKMRKTGVPVADIAKRFQMTTSAVSAAVRRQLERMNREALNAYPEVLRMELERLDSLQQAIWPLTQHRMIELPDGSQIKVDPDLKAVAEVRAIIAARSKLLGLEQTNVQIQVSDDAPMRVALAGHEKSEDFNFDPEGESRRMLKIMTDSGILDRNVLQSVLELEAGIMEAEVIE